jgi:hypothetical protein
LCVALPGHGIGQPLVFRIWLAAPDDNGRIYGQRERQTGLLAERMSMRTDTQRKNNDMRKLIEATFVSLDGVVESPKTWALPYFDDENKNYSLVRLSEVDAFLLGRVTYEKFAARWSQIKGDAYFDKINSLPKFVASTTLRETTWNAALIKGDNSGHEHSSGSAASYERNSTHAVFRRDETVGFQCGFLRRARTIHGGKSTHWPAGGTCELKR